jgi:hypothetical protein
MTKQVQRRRGTATQHTSFTGAEGELSVNTTNKTVHVHDGVTTGGIESARADLDNVSAADILSATGITASVAELNRVDGVTSPIQTQLNAKAPIASPTFTGTVTVPTADINGGTIDGTVIGGTTPAAGSFTQANFGDNGKAIFGAGSDLQIYHDGSNSYVKDVGAGNLTIQGSSQVNIGGANGTVGVQFVEGANVTLRHNNAPKLSTTSTGVDVTGTLSSDGLTVDGVSNANLQLSSTGGNTYQLRTDTNDAYIYQANRGKPLAKFEYGGDVSFYEDTGTTPKFFWDASAESLGIGTSSPTSDLSVGSTSTSSGDIALRTTKTAATIAPSNIAAGGLNVDVGWVSGGQGPLTFSLTGSEKMRIDSSGNVGIGTSSPSDTLSVVNLGSAGTGTQIVSGTTDTQPRFKVRTESYNGIVSVYDSGGNEDVRISANSGIDTYFNAGSNVGIGTNSPQKALHLAGSTAPYIMFDLRDDDVFAGEYSGGLLFMNSDDSTPSGDRISASIKAVAEDGYGRQGLTFSTGHTNLKTVYGDASDYTDATIERMRIDASGNVLVGQTTANSTVVGMSLRPSGEIVTTRDGANAISLNRKTSDGEIASFKKDGIPVGSIGSATSGYSLYFQAGDVGLKMEPLADDIKPCTSNGANRSGAIDLGDPAATFKDLYLSGGVYLGGTGAANKLDDYEEGTWTPTFGATGSSPSLTYFAQSGSYVKIGDMVYARYYLRVATVASTGSGVLNMNNLPFSFKNDPHNGWTGSVGWNGNLSGWGSNPYNLAGIKGTNTAFLHKMNMSTGSIEDLSATDLGANCQIEGHIAYQVA